MFNLMNKCIPYLILLLLFVIVVIGLTNAEFIKIMYEQLATLINIMIAAIVGFYVAPFIKKADAIATKNENIEKLSIEISDICNLSSEKILKLVDSKKSYPDYYFGPLKNIAGLRKIDLNFVMKMYQEHFQQLTYNQRKVIKSIISITENINDQLSKIDSDFKDKEVKIHNINNAVYHLCLLYWLTNRWCLQKNHTDFTFDNRADENLVSDALEALRITTTLEPLIKKPNK